MKHSCLLAAFFLGLASLTPYASGNTSAPTGPEDRILFPGAARMILVGPYAGIDFTRHTGNFTTTQNGLLCCSFEKGSGLGLAAGVKAFIPLGGNFDFSPRLLYENPGGEFTALLQQYPIRGQNNSVELVTLENTLDVTLHTLSVDLLAAYTFKPLGLYLALGPSAGFILANRFTKTETILGPPGVRYLDGRTAQEIFSESTEIPNTMTLSIRGGAGAMIPIGRGMRLNPELLYGFPLTTVSKDGEWKASTVQATIGVLFEL